MNIDTSTTEGKIAVMQAEKAGKIIEYKHWSKGEWAEVGGGCAWNWALYDFRVKPEPRVVYIYTSRVTGVSTLAKDEAQAKYWVSRACGSDGSYAKFVEQL